MYDHISHHSKHEKAVRYIYILSPGPVQCADRYYNMRLAITAVVTHFLVKSRAAAAVDGCTCKC